VKVTDYIPTITVDLKYATADNFTGTVIYGFTDAYLRYETVKKLMAVQEAVRQAGFRLKIWDAYRPVEAQYKLWEACPDPAFVANPNTGYSSHSRGNTLDVTLVKSDGSDVRMPTDFDDFSASADRDYSDVDGEAAANARFLEKEMTENGFSAYQGEWWHFSDTVSYDVEENFEP
jgi:D-alanyl-D-alanine dipeptidase